MTHRISNVKSIPSHVTYSTDLYSVFYLLQKSFIHSLRTPLSVISNELQYLQSKHGKTEVEIGLKKVEEIDAQLFEIGRVLNTVSEKVLLGKVLEEFKKLGFSLTPATADSAHKQLDTTYLLLPKYCSSLAKSLGSTNLEVNCKSQENVLELNGILPSPASQETTLCAYLIQCYPERDLMAGALIEILCAKNNCAAKVREANLLLEYI